MLQDSTNTTAVHPNPAIGIEVLPHSTLAAEAIVAAQPRITFRAVFPDAAAMLALTFEPKITWAHGAILRISILSPMRLPRMSCTSWF
jgi:hypothetical protein